MLALRNIELQQWRTEMNYIYKIITDIFNFFFFFSEFNSHYTKDYLPKRDTLVSQT